MFIKEYVPASIFKLPTNGVKIYSVELERENNIQFYKILGEIFSVDKEAPSINFEVNLPLEWNGKLVHFGGGGFNGFLVTGLGRVPCEGEKKPTALCRGFATCGSDSGHKNSKFWDASWSLNAEALENFAHAHIKKVKDVAFYLINEFYGNIPKKVFFVGSSNGGREALMAVQRYPNDFDGVIVGYPVFNWIPKILTDYRNMKIMDDAGPEGFISADDFIRAYAMVQKLLEENGCMQNGLVQNLYKCELLKEDALRVMGKILNNTQLNVLKNFYEPMSFEYELANEVSEMQGFSIVQQLCDKKLHPFGKVPCTRDGLFAKTVDAIVKYQILRDVEGDIRNFDYRKHKNEVLRVSEIMDATDYNLEKFYEKGGKLLLVHGTSDQLLSLHATINYYQKVVGYMGKERSSKFIKLFIVPGFGHDYGEIFNMHADVLKILDDWHETGVAPNEMVAQDQNKNTYGRIQILKPF